MINLPFLDRILPLLTLLTLANFLNGFLPVKAQAARTANSTARVSEPFPLDPMTRKITRKITRKLNILLAQRSEFNHLNIKLPTDGGTPTRRRSAGQRGPCSHLEKPLIALVPPTQNALNKEPESPDKALGETRETAPVFWFYVPQLPEKVREAEFRLLDENGDDVLAQKVIIEIPATPKIVGLSLPPTREPLVLNQKYQWAVSILCNANKPSQNPTVYAWIRRVEREATLTRQITQATDAERLRLYAENGLWHELLSLLAQLRRNQLEDSALAEVWTQLLKDIDLDDIATEHDVPYYFVPKE